jgi:hypothetical protein
MESNKTFIKNKTVFLSFTKASTTAEIFIPFAVDRIIFRALADDATTTKYAVLNSDLIGWETIGIVYRDSTFSNSTAQVNEYHYDSPQNINGRYNFTLKDLDGTLATIAGTESIVFICEFIRDGTNGKHSH